MQTVYSLDEPINDRPTVITMGKFDGLHRAHQHLIEQVVTRARELGWQSAVLTWDPHPSFVTQPQRDLRLLTDLPEKIGLIERLGPDLLIVAPFTTATMATSAEDYLAEIGQAVVFKELWVGENFAMGRGRAGTLPNLIVLGEQQGFVINTVAAQTWKDETISASRVRQALSDGSLDLANHLLGRSFSLQGTVIEGDKRGRTIGFPTANLAIDQRRMLPANGVYACYAIHGGERLPAVTNIGVRPTFDGVRRTVEAHLLDWSGDLYGQSLELTFERRLRGEHKFSSIEELINQIGHDADQAREFLAA